MARSRVRSARTSSAGGPCTAVRDCLRQLVSRCSEAGIIVRVENGGCRREVRAIASGHLGELTLRRSPPLTGHGPFPLEAVVG